MSFKNKLKIVDDNIRTYLNNLLTVSLQKIKVLEAIRTIRSEYHEEETTECNISQSGKLQFNKLNNTDACERLSNSPSFNLCKRLKNRIRYTEGEGSCVFRNGNGTKKLSEMLR